MWRKEAISLPTGHVVTIMLLDCMFHAPPAPICKDSNEAASFQTDTPLTLSNVQCHDMMQYLGDFFWFMTAKI
jgi:hypothetical protein